MFDKLATIQSHVYIYTAVISLVVLFIVLYLNNFATRMITMAGLYIDPKIMGYIYSGVDYNGRSQAIYHPDQEYDFEPQSFVVSPHYRAYLLYDDGRYEVPLTTQMRHVRARNDDRRIMRVEFIED